MSELQSYALDLLNMLPERSMATITGILLSPAKVVGLVYGMYKYCSPNYVDPMWRAIAEPDELRTNQI